VSLLQYPSLGPKFNTLSVEGEAVDVQFDRNMDRLAIVTAKELALISTQTGANVKAIERPVMEEKKPCSFRACRYGKGTTFGYLFVVINANDRKSSFVAKLNANSLDKELLQSVHHKPITAFAIDDTGSRLAFGTSDFCVGLLSAESLDVLVKINQVHQFSLTCLAFAPSGKTLVSGSADGTINVIHVPATFTRLSPSTRRILLALVVFLGVWYLLAHMWVFELFLPPHVFKKQEMEQSVADEL
jgi:prolactin regulatory element-binding protein